MKYLPLTFEESRLWVKWKLQPNLRNNLNIQYIFDGLIDIEPLSALSASANPLDAFRTYFIEEDVPYKIRLLENDFQVDVIDLTQGTHSNTLQLEELAN